MYTLIPTLSALVIFTVIFADTHKNGYKSVINPFFWTLLLCFFYLVLPSFFVNQINYYFVWGINSSSIYLSHFAIFVAVFSLSLLYFFNQSDFSEQKLSCEGYRISPLLKMLWWIVLLYLLIVLYITIKDFDVLDAFMYDNSQSDEFKIKNISYLLLALSTLYFLSEKNYWIFLPNLIITVLDLLHGSRTTALIALMPVVICLCIYRKTLFIVPGSILLTGMLLIGVIRSDNVVGGVPWYLNAIGEFREAYITLPLMIEDQRYVGQGGIFDAAATFGMGVLQPFRAQLYEHFTISGVYIANLVDRGYGLGANFIIESFFYGYAGFFFVLMFLIVVLLIFKRSLLAVKPHTAIVLVCLSVVFIRILVREGVFASLGLFSFIAIFYILPVFLVDKIKAARSTQL